MTCNYTNTSWLDVLYSDVRRTPGGVDAAARYLTERRGRSIGAQSLRNKLRGLEGESLSMEMVELLTEFMEESAVAVAFSKNWLQVFNVHQGLYTDYVPPGPENGWPDEAAALQAKFLETMQRMGEIANKIRETVADGIIEKREADELAPYLRELRVLSHRMERNAYRAAGVCV